MSVVAGFDNLESATANSRWPFTWDGKLLDAVAQLNFDVVAVDVVRTKVACDQIKALCCMYY